MCAQAWTLRSLLDANDRRVRPDALEAFNPTTFGRPVHRRVVAFAAECGLAVVGNSDAHEAAAVGTGWTTFAGRTAEDLRAAILAGASGCTGASIEHRQLPTFGRQRASTAGTRGPRSRAASAATARAATSYLGRPATTAARGSAIVPAGTRADMKMGS
jgi:hypothetical protein